MPANSPPGPSYLQKQSAHGRLRSLALGAPFPYSAHINVTSRCSFRCLHCYVDFEKDNEMPAAVITGALDELAGLGCLQVTFSGGEPLLRNDMLDILRHARARRFAFRLFTHANQLTNPAAVQSLVDTGVWEVHVSIYSARADIHDAVTRQPGSLKRSVQAIRWLREKNVVVVLKCPVMTLNYDSYLSVLDLAREVGADYSFDPHIGAGENGNREPLKYRLDDAQLRAVAQNPMLHAHDAPSQKRREETKQGADPVLRERLAARVCPAGHSLVNILSNGNVTPCLEWPLILGNVYSSPLKEIWKSAGANFVRGLTPRSFSRCSCDTTHSICPGRSLNETGNQLSFTPSHCLAHTAGLAKSTADDGCK